MFGKTQRFMAWLSCMGIVLVVLAACAPAAPPTPKPAPKPAATTALPKPGPTSAPTAVPAAKPAPTAAAPKPAPTAPPAAKPAPTAPPAAKPAPPTEWIVAAAEEVATLDPNSGASTTPVSSQVQQHLFDTLVTFEGLNLQLVPLLAESWKALDDRTWEFKLRKGVKFHNGDELTANDVKYSIDLYRDDKSPRKTYAAELVAAEVVDQYTVKLTTRGANPAIFVNVSNLPIMPREAREKAGADAFNRSPIGSGPFKFGEFVRGQRLVLEANPNYWRGQVSPKRLVLRPIPDPSTRVAEVKSGGVHIIDGPPIARLKELDSGDTELLALKGARLIIHPFNTTTKPFNDVRVRQAVNYAVDRDAIIKNVLEGYGVPLHGPFAPAWLGYDPSLQPYPRDVARAKQLLADAGYPNGFETAFNISSGVFLKDREIGEVVASQLAQVGIKVQVRPTERAKLQSDWTNGVFEGITSVAWGASADPDSMLGYAFYKRKAHAPDEKLTSLIEQTRRTVDRAQRTKLLQDLGRYAHDQAYWMFIHAQDEFYAKRKNVPWELAPVGDSLARMRYFRVGGP